MEYRGSGPHSCQALRMPTRATRVPCNTQVGSASGVGGCVPAAFSSGRSARQSSWHIVLEASACYWYEQAGNNTPHLEMLQLESLRLLERQKALKQGKGVVYAMRASSRPCTRHQSTNLASACELALLKSEAPATVSFPCPLNGEAAVQGL